MSSESQASVAYLPFPSIHSEAVTSAYPTPRTTGGPGIPVHASKKRTLESILTPPTSGSGKDNDTPTSPLHKKPKVVQTSVSVWNQAPSSRCA